MALKLVQVVKLNTVVYTWSCFNCGAPVRVKKKQYLALKKGQGLRGVQCGCLKPGGDGVALSNVA